MADRKPREELRFIVKPFREAAVFSGRSTRSEALFFVWPVASLLKLLDYGLVASDVQFALPLRWLLFVALTAPLFALMARRAHDFDAPGWVGWSAATLLLGGSFYAGQLPGQQQVNVSGLEGAIILLLIVGLWALTLWPPSPGTNRYGLNPRPEARASTGQ